MIQDLETETTDKACSWIMKEILSSGVSCECIAGLGERGGDTPALTRHRAGSTKVWPKGRVFTLYKLF